MFFAMEHNNKKFLRTIAIIITVLVIALSVYIGNIIIEFINDPENFRQWIDSFGVFSPLAFIFISLLQILIPFIPGEPMEIVAGYAFGSFEGTLLCLISVFLGSFIVVSLVKKYGRRLVELFFEKEKIESLNFLKSSKRSIELLLILFVIPGTPKDLLCYFAGLTDIKTKTLLLIATLGRIPSIITSTIFGGALGDQNYKASIIVFSITTIVTIIGILVYNRQTNNSNEKKF